MLKKLSNKGKKALIKTLETQFGFTKKLEYNFFINDKHRVFLFNKDLEIDFSKIRVNSLGLYFANIENELRLTIEGSQLIGPHAQKNILTLSDKDLDTWIYGKDLKTKEIFEGFVLIQNKKDFYGTGKFKDGKILNYVPKERRLHN